MRIRLTRKLADCIDGVDLSHHAVGDVLELPMWKAQLVIAEGWALPSEDPEGPQPYVLTDEELDCLGQQLESWAQPQNQRRAEDRIREELRESREVTVRRGKKRQSEAT